MSFFSNLIVPLVLCAVFLGALVQRVDLLSAFARGVREGLQVVLDMFPSLMLLTLAVSVFQSSGALELLSRALSAPAAVRQRGAGGVPEYSFPVWPGQPGRADCQRADRLDRNHLLHHRPVLLGGGHQKKPLRRARLAVRRPDGLCRQRGGGAVADGVEKSGSRNRDQAGNWNQFPA